VISRKVVGPDPVLPANHALDLVEQRARVTAGEEDREPRADGGQKRADRQEEQHDVVGDRQQPLDQRQPAAELVLGVRVGEVEVDGLLPVGGGVAVVRARYTAIRLLKRLSCRFQSYQQRGYFLRNSSIRNTGMTRIPTPPRA